MKNFKIIISFLFLSVLSANGQESLLPNISSSQNNDSYVNKSNNGLNTYTFDSPKQNFNNLSVKQIDSFVVDKFTDTKIWNSDGGYICGNVLKNGTKLNNVTVELTDIDFSSGKYLCSYIDNSGEVFTTKTGQIKTIESINLNLKKSSTILNKDYKVDDIKILKDKQSLIKKSASLWHGKYFLDGTLNEEKDDKTRITFTKTLVGLATLNNSYIDGVNSNGEIIYSKQMLDNVPTQISRVNEFEKKEKGIEYYNPVGMLSDYLSGKKYNYIQDNLDSTEQDKESYSYLNYFDKHIFAYYYLLDKFTFDQVFTNGVFVILAVVMAYLSFIVGVKSLSKKIGNERFEFNYIQQMMAFGGLFLLTFIPIGGSVNSSNGETQIVAKTSIAKELIGTFGDYGARLADMVSDNGNITYLYYLGNKVGEHSKKALKTMKSEFAEDVSTRDIMKGFYNTHCLTSYQNNLNDGGELKYSHWYQNMSSEWDSKKNLLFQSELKEVRVSAPLCNNIKTGLINYKMDIDANFSKLKNGIKKYAQGERTNYDVFVDTELLALENYGFLATAGMPILHLFSKYNSAFEDEEHSRKELKEMNEQIAKANVNREGQGRSSILQYGGNMLGSVASQGVDYGVFFMMPFFNDVYSFSKGIVVSIGGSIETIIEGLSYFNPVSRFASIGLDATRKIKDFMKKDRDKFDIKGKVAGAGLGATTFLLSLKLAEVLYMFFLNIILIGVISLFIVAKILFWIIDIVKYRYVTSFVVFWSITVNQNSSKIGEYLARGVVLLIARPVLIVMSILLFIFTYEIMNSIYFLITDLFSFMLEQVNYLGNDSFLGRLFINTFSAVGKVLINLFGIYLAYILILEGDNWFLKQLGYSDSGDTSQAFKPLSDKIDKSLGKV